MDKCCDTFVLAHGSKGLSWKGIGWSSAAKSTFRGFLWGTGHRNSNPFESSVESPVRTLSQEVSEFASGMHRMCPGLDRTCPMWDRMHPVWPSSASSVCRTFWVLVRCGPDASEVWVRCWCHFGELSVFSSGLDWTIRCVLVESPVLYLSWWQRSFFKWSRAPDASGVN